MSILKTINLVKMYGQEPNIVKALDNVSIERVCSHNRYIR